ncbi:FecR family protein [Acinetobacter populi]|uniref:FecR protein domain-containing protein n=1 Tax=Acinetobacter populi TaxID=1582270 RepID=A0A1Z9YYA3_9GAMM|nr:FecR domain-containing protein [Acinetobacter populi]OUY07195.1 hypothetical protein CAP51_10980 [Acinetobacter populi]
MSDISGQIPSTSDEDISAQAAEWLVRLDDEGADQTIQHEFALWLAKDPRHIQAIERMKKLLGDVEAIHQHYPHGEIAKNILQESLKTAEQSRAHYLYQGLGVLLMCSALVIFFASQYAPLDYWTADQRNRSQSWQQYALPDNSHVKVSGKTAYNLQFDQQQRTLQLLQGNILVDVAKDARRPFKVVTSHGTIQALGTRFMVTQDGQRTILTMLESKTAVWSEQQANEKIQVVEGQRIEINAQGIVNRQPIQINAHLLEQAWEQHKLVANGDDLTDILDYLAMYYSGKIIFDRASLQGIQVTATLPLDDVEKSLQALAEELNLDIQHSIPYVVKVVRKE